VTVTAHVSPARVSLPGVDEEVAASLLRCSRTRVATRDQCIFTEGDPGGPTYLVTSGRVKTSRRTATGSEGILAVLGPGQILGELSLLEEEPRSASAHAITDATLAELAPQVLKGLLEERPEIARWLLQHLSHRLRLANDAVTNLVFSGVPARVAQVLLSLAHEFGVATDHGIDIEHGLTQKEIAQLAGATRESTNKALSNFARRNWITLRSGSIHIDNLAALQHRAR
jgi:CRP-like cAMP-binding protein